MFDTPSSDSLAGAALGYLVRSSLGLHGASNDDRGSSEAGLGWQSHHHQVDGLSLFLPLLLRTMAASRSSHGSSSAGVRDVIESMVGAAGLWLKAATSIDFSTLHHGSKVVPAAQSDPGVKLVSLALSLPLLVGLDDISQATRCIERLVLDSNDEKRIAVLNHLWTILLASDDYERKTGLAHWYQSLLKPARSRL